MSRSSSNNNSSSSGIGFFGLLQIVFIALKLCGVINWSWGLVLIPVWIWLIIFIGSIVFLVWFMKK